MCLIFLAVGWLQPGTQACAEGQTASRPTVPVHDNAPAQTSVTPARRQGESEVEPNIPPPPPITGNLRAWTGLRVAEIRFTGVTAESLAPLPSQIDLKVGQPLEPDQVRSTLRRLYASGLYTTVDVEGIRQGDSVVIVFNGQGRLFFGRVEIKGVKSDSLSTVLSRATNLQAGQPWNDSQLAAGERAMNAALMQNGYYQATVSSRIEAQPQFRQVNAIYVVKTGKQARVGAVTVIGSAGLPLSKFRKTAKLKKKTKVDRDTNTRALANLRKYYQKKNYLEADLRLTQQQFQPKTNTVDYTFTANQGPTINVIAPDAGLSRGRIQKLVPVYEEGAVDVDLLNEGARNIRDYEQRQGYFDASVTHDVQHKDSNHDVIVYNVHKGVKHKVISIRITGNRYFDQDTLRERLSVKQGQLLTPFGTFSQKLVNADAAAITALYKANGFADVKVTPTVQDTDRSAGGKKDKYQEINVVYAIQEGKQQTFGPVVLTGVAQVKEETLRNLMNTTPGQPYSLANLSGDRDTLLSYYLSNGFSQAQLEVNQQPEKNNPSIVDIRMDITEGKQFFVKDVLLSGLHFTKPTTTAPQITVAKGDPLDESALLDTQRNLYNLALFNEVNTAIQNPDGGEQRKNVLIQTHEARRYLFTYGFGFEAQTGQPNRNCPSVSTLIQLGLNPNSFACSPNGRTGASPRVLFDATRTNLFGRNQTLTFQGAYGLLEQRATGIFQNPRFFNRPSLTFSVSGGYTNSQDVTTYAASALQGTAKLTESLHLIPTTQRARDTLIYQFAYRRVKVDPNSIQVSAAQIPLLSQPVRVGGPGFTYLRDTRDAPLDATRGTYLSLQESFFDSPFGSQANFNRIDVTNSSYYAFNKRRYVLARSTRYGVEQTFDGTVSIDQSVANPKLQPVPLPERLYAGGATSLRGFPINQAGPRDLQTGFPIGGTGAFVNQTELRMPPLELPVVGNAVSLVAFHDMGNVFKNASDIWSSFFRIKQPNSGTCKVVAVRNPNTDLACNFNDFSHAVGLGLRYKTPIGPIRADFSYNMNPPIYPVYYNFNNELPHYEQASHFNFFFSVGQSF